MKTIYKTSLDKYAKISTIGALLLFIGIALLPKILDRNDINEIPILVISLFIVTFGGSYLFCTKSYELNENQIIIVRPFKNVIIEKSQIFKIIKLEKGKLSGAIRTFGVGGLFGYFGKFWNKEFGHMTWYATNIDNAILILTKEKKKIIITPNEAEKFFAEFNELMK